MSSESQAGHELSPELFKRIGGLPYLNGKPLVYGIEDRIVLAPPSALARMLRRGALDAALVSIVEVLLTGKYFVLDQWAIASDGPVQSVLLFHRPPLQQVRLIYCDRASMTSVILLRLLLREQGFDVELRPLPAGADPEECEAVLLIGDTALKLAQRRTDHRILDLGQAWKEFTGLPFVFAVWALRPGPTISSIAELLHHTALYGTSHLDEVAARCNGFDYQFRLNYLSRAVRYRLTPEAREGIEAFIRLLRRYRSTRIYPPRYWSVELFGPASGPR